MPAENAAVFLVFIPRAHLLHSAEYVMTGFELLALVVSCSASCAALSHAPASLLSLSGQPLPHLFLPCQGWMQAFGQNFPYSC